MYYGIKSTCSILLTIAAHISTYNIVVIVCFLETIEIQSTRVFIGMPKPCQRNVEKRRFLKCLKSIEYSASFRSHLNMPRNEYLTKMNKV